MIVSKESKEEKIMNYYERRFYEDIHKLVTIQREILNELKKMNEPLVEVKVIDPESVDKKCEI